jgi:hypothetical protein
LNKIFKTDSSGDLNRSVIVIKFKAKALLFKKSAHGCAE